MPILRNLISYEEDSDDIHQPLLLWWALESKANGEGREAIQKKLLSDKQLWSTRLMKEHLLERLAKRYALSATREELLAAAKLFKASPNANSSRILLKGFEDAYKGRSLAEIPDELVDAIAATGEGSLPLKLRQGTNAAIAEAIAAVSNPKVSLSDRSQLLEIFGEIRQPEFIPVLLEVVQKESNPKLISAALTALTTV